jgi:BASS family bile acid:Na+ symporter
MDLKQIIVLALQVSIACMVFGFGLKAAGNDLLYLIRRPGLLARSLFAVFVAMPLLVVALVRMFDLPPAVQVVLVALAISPIPPILPRKETAAGGDVSYGLGLMAILSLVSIVAIPLVLEILSRVFGHQFAMAPGAIAAIVVKSTLAPLVAGMAVRAVWPAFAKRVANLVTLVGNVLLPAALLPLLVGALPAMWAAIGQGTVLAMVIVTVAGLAIGHFLGGPNPHRAVVLALSTACRHPAIALTIAATNFPNQHFGPLVLLYLIVSAVAAIPYLKWQQPNAPPSAARAA